MPDKTVFLGLQDETGDMIYEKLDRQSDLTPDEILAALDDCSTLYIWAACPDEKFGGLMPATHLDYLKKYERRCFGCGDRTVAASEVLVFSSRDPGGEALLCKDHAAEELQSGLERQDKLERDYLRSLKRI